MIPGLSNLIIDPLPPRDNHCVPSVLFSVLRARLASTEKAHWCSTFCRCRLLGMCLWVASHQLRAQNTFPPTALPLRGLFLDKGSQSMRTYILSLFVEKSISVSFVQCHRLENQWSDVSHFCRKMETNFLKYHSYCLWHQGLCFLSLAVFEND